MPSPQAHHHWAMKAGCNFRLICLSGGLSLIALATVGAGQLDPAAQRHTARMSYIENQRLRLGVDLNLGGAITYLAPATNHNLNLINSHDWGRQVQLSFYSGPTPFKPLGVRLSKNWEGLGWNPIQSGDFFGHESRVLEQRQTRNLLYVKCVPMHWPLDNYPGECTFEVWLELDGPCVKARCRLRNARPDLTQYPARNQELPAVYVNAPYHCLLTYAGDKPFTSDALRKVEGRLDLDHRWAHWLGTEHWAALVNDSGWGLGVWNPDALAFDGGLFLDPGAGGPSDAATGYLGPVKREILDHDIVYEYRYELILGTVEEIRARVYELGKSRKLPGFDFPQGRAGWYYENACDSGWPVRGELDIRPSGPAPQVFSPLLFVRAEEAPVLRLRAAFETGRTNAVVGWRRLEDSGYKAEQTLGFGVVPDGKFHAYRLPLHNSLAYRGGIVQLRLDLFDGQGTNARVRLKSVAFEPED
jgi:hypothetical protein